MKLMIIVLMLIIAVLVVVCYACLVVASEADEKAKRMYRAWKESIEDERSKRADDL